MNRATFLEKFNRLSSQSCWEWGGACNSTGYGNLLFEGKYYTAHRVMAYLTGLVDSPAAPKNRKGGGFVLHACDNTKCCNPIHFTVGSYRKNQLDAYKRQRRTQPKGQGHVNAKLTNVQAELIRKRHKAGELQVSLAKEYNVSQRVISLITRGETYT